MTERYAVIDKKTKQVFTKVNTLTEAWKQEESIRQMKPKVQITIAKIMSNGKLYPLDD